MKGMTKWFSPEKGFGFITPEDGGKDIFVHHTAIDMEGYRSLTENQPVTFEIEVSQRGPRAIHVIPQ